MNQSEALTKLLQRGVTKAVAYFSGGNDEGWVESIVLYDATDTKLDTIREVYYGEDETEDSEIAKILGQPVYAQYGSFAGEFYVSGEVTWNVRTREWVMNDQYETMEDRYSDEPSYSDEGEW